MMEIGGEERKGKNKNKKTKIEESKSIVPVRFG